MTVSDIYLDFDRANILITGSLGFIGSSLARRLVQLSARATLVHSLVLQYSSTRQFYVEPDHLPLDEAYPVRSIEVKQLRRYTDD